MATSQIESNATTANKNAFSNGGAFSSMDCGSTGGVESNGSGTGGSGDSGSSAHITETTAKNAKNNNKHTKATVKNYGKNSQSNSEQKGAKQRNQQRVAIENGKRKKLRSRNITTPTTAYSKDNLDAWLENCIKDATKAQLSSSSDFLDFDTPAVDATTTTTTKKPPQHITTKVTKHAKQHQQQQQQQQQHPTILQQSYPAFNMHNLNQLQQQQQQLLGMRTNVPAMHFISFPNNFGIPPYGQNLQRNVPNCLKTSNNSLNTRLPPSMYPGNGTNGSGLSSAGGGGGGGVGSFYSMNDDSQDFASLPSMHNIMGNNGGVGGFSELDNNSNGVLNDGANNQANMARGFRFSDPCLLNPSDNDSKLSGQNTPDRRNPIGMTAEMHGNKLFAALMEQINILHETNTKICNRLHETRAEVDTLKNAPTWGGMGAGMGMRHRRDSLSGLSTQSQPLAFGGGFGTQSPAPTFHSGASYTPGMTVEIVREVKEAARVREDAMLNRVKAMVEEHQWTEKELSLRLMRDIEELKSQVHHLRVDRKEANKRLTQLEAENKYLQQMFSTLISQRQMPEVIYENERNYARTRQPRTRRAQSFNLHYATIYQQPPSSAVEEAEEDDDDNDEVLHVLNTATAANDLAKQQQQQQQVKQKQQTSSCTSSERSTDSVHTSPPIINGSGGIKKKGSNKMGPIMSPPNFALISSPPKKITSDKSHQKQQQQHNKKQEKTPKNGIQNEEKEKNDDGPKTAELQREIEDAVAARKDADARIIALEKLVNKLQLNTSIINNSTTNTATSLHNSSSTTIATTIPPIATKSTNGNGFNLHGGGINNLNVANTVTTATPAVVPNTTPAACAGKNYNDESNDVLVYPLSSKLQEYQWQEMNLDIAPSTSKGNKKWHSGATTKASLSMMPSFGTQKASSNNTSGVTEGPVTDL